MELILVSCCLGSSVDTWKEMHLERGFIQFEPCRIANCSSKDKKLELMTMEMKQGENGYVTQRGRM